MSTISTRINMLVNNFNAPVSIVSTDHIGTSLYGDNAVPPGTSGNTGKMKVPMPQGLTSWEWDGHHIKLYATGLKYFLWKARGSHDILYATTRPSSDADGTFLAAEKDHYSITVAEDGSLSALAVDTGALTDDAKDLKKQYADFIATLGDAAVTFWNSDSGQNIITDMGNNLTKGSFDGTNYAQQVLNDPAFADLDLQSNPIGATMIVGLTGDVSYGIGLTSVLGVAFDMISGEIGGYWSGGVTFGFDAGFDVGFQIGFSLQKPSDMDGFGFGVMVKGDLDVGAGISFSFDGSGFTGLAVEFGGGEEIEVGVSVDYSETFGVTETVNA